jgi:hypothetical protein
MFYTDYGYLVPADDRRARLTVRDLNRRQLEYFQGYLDAISNDTAVFTEPDTVMSTGYRTNPVRQRGTGTLSLYRDRIVFAPNGTAGGGAGTPAARAAAADAGSRGATADAGGLTFSLAEIDGLNVQLTRKLELYHRGRLYTFDPTDRKRSMYKWQVAIDHLTRQDVFDPGLSR